MFAKTRLRQLSRPFATLIAVAMMAIHSYGQQVKKDPDATVVAQRAMAALGGADVPYRIKDSLAKGTITFHFSGGDQTGTIVLKTKGKDKVRTEIQQPSGVSTEILNAGEGVFVEPDGATRKLLLNNTLAERAWHIPSLSLLGEADLPKTEVASGRAASENSRDTNVISLSLPTSSDESHVTTFREMTRRDFHIDRQSGLVTKMEHPSSYENGMSGPKVEILYSDYRNISGVMVPFKINTVLDGRLFSEVVLTDVQFNVGLADSDFVLPEVK